MVLAIAVCPLSIPHWWESNRNKLVVACALGLPVVGVYVLRHPHVLVETAEEYVSFMLLLTALYVIAGGVRLSGDLEATPLVNTTFLATGSAPCVVPRHDRRVDAPDPPGAPDQPPADAYTHTVIFFIFLVSNIGGLLTPLGDPPLFLGYLQGVPFDLDLPPLAAVAVHRRRCCCSRTSCGTRSRTGGSRPAPASATRRSGAPSGSTAPSTSSGSREWCWASRSSTPRGGRCSSWRSRGSRSGRRPREVHRANEFTPHPMVEVAVLFLGIFVTMIPALELLRGAGRRAGRARAVAVLLGGRGDCRRSSTTRRPT